MGAPEVTPHSDSYDMLPPPRPREARPERGAAGYERSLATPSICPDCRYDLRGVSSARCPECGHDFSEAVEIAHSRAARWLELAPMRWAFILALAPLAWAILRMLAVNSAKLPYSPLNWPLLGGVIAFAASMLAAKLAGDEVRGSEAALYAIMTGILAAMINGTIVFASL
ncbi:MAG: hypothetical protein ACF8PN_07275 [Phycisphaerales bacterium]